MNQLNLPEFRVLKVEENEQKDLKFTVEAIKPIVSCPECGNEDCYKHAPMERFVRDLNMFNQRVGIVVKGNRYKCKQCGKTFTEKFYSIDDRDKITIRLKEHIKELSLKEPFKKIGDIYTISPTTVKRIFNEYVEEQERAMIFETPRVLGIDEVHLNKKMRCIFTDIEKLKILDMLPNRSKKDVIKFLSKVPDLHKVEVVTMDMWRPYKDSITETIPKAHLVVDKYHVVQYVNKALDTVRKSFRETLSPQQRKQLMRDRFVLLRNKEDLIPADRLNRDIWFTVFPTLRTAYYIKEGLRDMYLCETKQQALAYYKEWKSSIPADMKPFIEVASIFDNWNTEIFNYFDHFVTNAFTESRNNSIKEIEKRGRGYSFEVLRAKILFGTRATIRPKYDKDNGYMRIGKMTLNSFNFDYSEPQLEEGFGVSIPQLLEVIERDDF